MQTIDLATLKTALEAMKNRTDRSAWNRGVTVYARELLDDVIENVAHGMSRASDARRI